MPAGHVSGRDPAPPIVAADGDGHDVVGGAVLAEVFLS
jgi:hypothetical protein